MCLLLRGEWLLSDSLGELRLQPRVQHAQARGGTCWAWIGFLWLCIVKEWEQIWCPRSLGVVLLESRRSSRALGHGTLGFLQGAQTGQRDHYP